MSSRQRRIVAIRFICGMPLLCTMSLMLGASGATMGFADAAATTRSARTATYTETITPAGKPPTTAHVFIAAPDRSRTEWEGKFGMISIRDGTTTLTLEPRSKQATKLIVARPTTRAAGMSGSTIVDALFRDRSRGTLVGERIIDGIAARGFRTVAGNGATNTAWIDAKTGELLRTEATVPQSKGATLVVRDHFKLDVPLDDALFSLDPPAGYTLSERTITVNPNATPEEAVINLLRAYAALNDNAFPPKVDDMHAYAAMVTQKLPAGKERDAFIGKMGAAMAKLLSLTQGYGYAGAGVKLGEKEKIIFWYKPSGAERYRAVFGDLNVDDVSSDRLPATQPSAR